MKKFLPLLLLLISIQSFAQLSPAITNWQINSGSHTGFAGILTNVQQVQYSTNNVYISTTDIADWIPVGYNWPNNPWSPQNKNYTFKITLNPMHTAAPPVIAPYGHIGIWTNGVSIYNPKDAKSYLDSSKWFQNAFFFEHLNQETMDTCLGHPNGNFEYHTHVHPKCLYHFNDTQHHAPLIGYAFDGFPIYGAYGFSNPNVAGTVKRMKTSYRLRNITNRTVLPNGTALQPVYYGPSISTAYPLGAYCEDFEFVNGLGDLDIHNGRNCVTPEYPNGTYAYFISLDSLMQPQYPYVMGPTYYGTVQPGNLGPSGGFNTITETVTNYVAPTSVNNIVTKIEMELFPNPADYQLNFQMMTNNLSAEFCGTITNLIGEKITEGKLEANKMNIYDTRKLQNGIYFLTVNDGEKKYAYKFLVHH